MKQSTLRNVPLRRTILVKRRSSSVLVPLAILHYVEPEVSFLMTLVKGHDIAQDFFNHGIDVTM